MLIDYKDSRTLGTFLTRARQDHPAPHHRHLRPAPAPPHRRDQAGAHGGAAAVHQRLSLRRAIDGRRGHPARRRPEPRQDRRGGAREARLRAQLPLAARPRRSRRTARTCASSSTRSASSRAKAERERKTAEARGQASSTGSKLTRPGARRRGGPALRVGHQPRRRAPARRARASPSTGAASQLDEPIKQLGTYPVVVQVGRDVRATVQVVGRGGRRRAGVARGRRSGGGRAGRRSRRARPRRSRPYAMRSRDSRGRRHPEPEHPFRMVFQRDRDRIIHSTRVPPPRVQDAGLRQPRGRLLPDAPHAHDGGRAGHAHARARARAERGPRRGRRARARPRPHAVRPRRRADARPPDAARTAASSTTRRACASSTCSRSAIRDFRGLNLSWEVREGIVKHSTRYDRPQVAEFDASLAPCLEAQIVDFADEIAYNAHDVDDGLKSGMLDPDDLATVPLWADALARRRRPTRPARPPRSCATRRCAGSSTAMVTDLVETLLARHPRRGHRRPRRRPRGEAAAGRVLARDDRRGSAS